MKIIFFCKERQVRNNAVLFPGRQFWLRRGKNEKWVFFHCVDDAVDDVFTKVAGAVDRLGIISHISKFHRRAQDEDEEGKKQQDCVILNTKEKLVFGVSYTRVSRNPWRKLKNPSVCIFTLFANSANISQI